MSGRSLRADGRGALCLAGIIAVYVTGISVEPRALASAMGLGGLRAGRRAMGAAGSSESELGPPEPLKVRLFWRTSLG